MQWRARPRHKEPAPRSSCLPNEDSEARHGRLFGVAKKVHLWAGGRKVVPDGALLPLARTRPQRPDPREGAGPRPVLALLLPKPWWVQHWCWMPRSPAPAGSAWERYGSILAGYARRGAFSPYSRHASLIEVSAQFGREVPADYPLPVAPQQVRKAKHTCRRPGCPFKTEGTKSICDRPSGLGRRQDVTSTCMLWF